MTYRKCF